MPRYKPKKVGILGAGMMGAGIAYAQASRGIATVLKDVSLDKAEHGKAYSAKLTQARVDKGRMSPHDQAELLARITPTASAADLQGCDLIIEAVFENRELKAKVTQEAEPMLAPGGFFASNTSTLPISGLATASAQPGEVHRHPLLQPGGQDEAGGNHPRQADRRRNRGARLRLRAGAGQDPDRGERLARLLHQPHLRHLRDGRRGHAGRRHSGRR